MQITTDFILRRERSEARAIALPAAFIPPFTNRGSP